MKILWITNIVFPKPSMRIGLKESNYGGWLISLFEELIKSNELNLAVATIYNGKELIELICDEATYYLLPSKSTVKYDKQLEKFWKEVIIRFKPDIVHINGTEYPFSLALMRACPQLKFVTSIQGLVSVYVNTYLSNMAFKDLISTITPYQLLRKCTIFHQKNSFVCRSTYEKEIIKGSKAVIGRTTWDYSNAFAINQTISYYYCNESIRKEFFNYSWNLNDSVRHSIFMSQASYPIKGLHFMIQALFILKKIYPNIILTVAGQDFIDKSSLVRKIKQSGYSIYIRKIIKKLDLSNNIQFTGELNADEMARQLCKANVFVCCSSVENSPNSLCEAMLVGTPCVASYVGGIPDIIEHNKNGFTYPFTEVAMLAEYIKRIFDDDQIANRFSEDSRESALTRHDMKYNLENIMNIYRNL